MTTSIFSSRQYVNLNPSKFARPAPLPLQNNYLWQIETEVVRTLTWLENVTIVTLGLWGKGQIVGPALSKPEPYQIE